MKKSTQDKPITQREVYWHRHIERHLGSGLSQAKYCIEHDLNPKQFWSWKKKLRPDTIQTFKNPAPSVKKTKSSSDFIVIEPEPLTPAIAPQVISCKFPNGIELSWPSSLPAEQVSSLIQVVNV